MTSHWSFGHLQPKLWAKEGLGVKLAIWLPTAKSWESTHSRRALGSATRRWKDLNKGYNIGFDLVPIRGWGEELWLFKVPGVQPGHIRDSISGVPGQKAIRMPPPRSNAEYTIGSKVVAYSRVRAMVSLMCPSARGKSQHPRVSRMLN